MRDSCSEIEDSETNGERSDVVEAQAEFEQNQAQNGIRNSQERDIIIIKLAGMIIEAFADWHDGISLKRLDVFPKKKQRQSKQPSWISVA